METLVWRAAPVVSDDLWGNLGRFSVSPSHLVMIAMPKLKHVLGNNCTGIYESHIRDSVPATWECNLASMEFTDSAIDGDYFEFLFDVFGKNLVRFKYHDRQANSNDCNFEPLVFAAALQKVRGTLEELEIRADELWGDVTIGSLQDFPRLKRITISPLLLVSMRRRRD